VIRARSDLAQVRRIVVKIGSSLLADSNSGIRSDTVQRLAAEVAALRARGIEVALVTSGAVALGRVRLGWVGRKLSVHEKQAAAAVGQPMLMHAYNEAFAAHEIATAQLLLTKDDLRNRRRYLNANNTGETLFSAGVLPIVNENDTVVVEEIKFGDNDSLSALVGLLLDADLVVMLTDVDGLFDANPNSNPAAKRISDVAALGPEIFAMAGDAGSHFGTGGMTSKLRASKVATRGGVCTAIVNGRVEQSLSRLLTGEDVGTLFLCGEDRQSRRRHWIVDILKPAGAIHVDSGAARAIVERGSSLLPVGVTAVEGIFDKGECVEIRAAGAAIARGLCNYNAEEMRRLIGVASHEIEAVLGYSDFTSVIHRDNLVLHSDQ